MMKKIWGEGLEANWYLGQHLSLRRNSLVYEVYISIGSLRTTFLYHRKKTK